MASVPQVETLIKEQRSVEKTEPPYRVLWDDSFELTQFLLKWNARPKVFSITQVFIDELRRRRGLQAYGIRFVARRSRINQITTGVKAFEPRQLDVAQDKAA